MHMTPRSGFWSWKELLYLQDNLSAAQWRPREEGGLRKDKLRQPQPCWRYTRRSRYSCPLPASHYMDIAGHLWLFVRRNGSHPQLGLTNTLPRWEGKMFALLDSWQVTVFVPNLQERLPKSRSELSVQQHWRTKTPPVLLAACPSNAFQHQRLGVHPMEDASEQNSAGQWKVVWCWLSKKPSDALFLIPTYWRWCWDW